MMPWRFHDAPCHESATTRARHGAFMRMPWRFHDAPLSYLGVPANTPTPADLFMQSVVKRDAALGWHQLCSPVQAQVPLASLVDQVERQRIAEAGEGLTLSVDYIGAHAQPQGGQIRLYVVTAHRRDRWVQQRTYIVYTQAGGCVEDVKSS